jgi:hypothetical protein
MIKDSKAKDIEALYEIQKGNIYKVTRKRNSRTLNIPMTKNLLKKSFNRKKTSPIKKDALSTGGEIYTPTDSSIETKIDPI